VLFRSFNTCVNQFSDGSINSIVAHRNSRTCLSPLEPSFTAFPFSDMFPGSEIDEALWTGIDGTPEVNTDGLNEPSGDSSLNISGSDELRSARLDTSLQEDLMLTYQYERAGGADSPEAGEDLVLEYLDADVNWIEIDRILGDGPDMTAYDARNLMLPIAAEHENLRIRFRNLSSSDDFDDYFIDDISITGTPVFPGSFSLRTPFDGATGVSISPTFIWNISSNAAAYQLQIDNDSDFSSLILDFTTAFPSFDNPGFTLTPGTEYFWRVIASNVNGSVTSVQDPSSFTIFNIAPTSFSLTSPSSGSATTNDEPVFT